MTTNIPVSSYQHWVIQLLDISTTIWTTWSNLELDNLRLDPNLQINYHVNKNAMNYSRIFILFIFYFQNRSLCCLREWFECHHPSTVAQVLHGTLSYISATSQPCGWYWGIELWRNLLKWRWWRSMWYAAYLYANSLLIPLVGLKCCDMAVHIAKHQTWYYSTSKFCMFFAKPQTLHNPTSKVCMFCP
jgi:hypothetical protein